MWFDPVAVTGRDREEEMLAHLAPWIETYQQPAERILMPNGEYL